MKIGIIGGGISGLAAARMLAGTHEVCVFEKSDRPGGLIKCDVVSGVLYHKVGGHVFNSLRPDVMAWFRAQFDTEHDFTHARRNAAIALPGGHMVGYPIENNITRLPRDMQTQALQELQQIAKQGETPIPDNFADFLKVRFGNTLYESYFAPYNAKVWRRPLTDVPLNWLQGKLPMPDARAILQANSRHEEERAMVHSSFLYPRRGGSQFLADTLAKGLDIRFNADVSSLRKVGNSWEIMGKKFDAVIYTGNVKALPALLAESVDLTGEAPSLAALEHHGTTTVLCETEPTPYSWVYLPDPAYTAHRIICTGNFSPANAPQGITTATIEFSARLERAEIEAELAQIPFRPRYLAHHWEPYTYPVQTAVTRPTIAALKSKLAPLGLHLLGRFAEWEYYNMDAAIGAALDLTVTLY